MIILLLLAACALAACAHDAPPAATAPAPALPPGVRFTDVTAAAGITFRHHAGDAVKDYIVEAKGGGVAILDADGDGWLDLFFVDGGSLAPGGPAGSDALYRNEGDGTFADVSAVAGVARQGRWGMGAIAGDADGNGDTDLLVTHLAGAVLLRNDGDVVGPRFAADPRLAVDGWATGAAWADYDQDGDLDLYVARYVDFDVDAVPPRAGMWKGLMVFAGPQGLPALPDVLLRNDDGLFTDVSAAAGLRAQAPAWGLGVVFADLDDDGDADAYVANDSARNHLWRNDGPGAAPRFREVALETRSGLSAEGIPQAGMGIAYGDFDADGDRDLFLTHFEDDYNTLYRNDGGVYTVVSAEAGLAQPSIPMVGFGTCFLDADNDGDLDLAVGNGHVYPQIRLLDGGGGGGRVGGYLQPGQLFLNGGAAARYRFAQVAAGDLDRPALTRALVPADWDEDGDVDLVAVRLDGPPALLRNDGAAGAHWLTVALAGRRGNPDAFGAVVRLTVAGAVQTVEVVSGGGYLSQGDMRAHFGLGVHDRVDAVEVRWPDGAVTRHGPLAADRRVRLDPDGGCRGCQDLPAPATAP